MGQPAPHAVLQHHNSKAFNPSFMGLKTNKSSTGAAVQLAKNTEKAGAAFIGVGIGLAIGLNSEGLANQLEQRPFQGQDISITRPFTVVQDSKTIEVSPFDPSSDMTKIPDKFFNNEKGKDYSKFQFDLGKHQNRNLGDFPSQDDTFFRLRNNTGLYGSN